MDDANAAETEAAADAESAQGTGRTVGRKDCLESPARVVKPEAVDAGFAVEQFNQIAIQLDRLGIVDAGEGLSGRKVNRWGQGGGAETTDKSAVKVSRVVAVRGKADHIEEIAGADGNGVLGGDKDAVVLAEQGEMLFAKRGSDDAADANAVARLSRSGASDGGWGGQGEDEWVAWSGLKDLNAGEIRHERLDTGELLSLIEAAAHSGAKSNFRVDEVGRNGARGQLGHDIEPFIARGNVEEEIGGVEAGGAVKVGTSQRVVDGANDAFHRDPAGIHGAG